jgi:hypothetical protein
MDLFLSQWADCTTHRHIIRSAFTALSIGWRLGVDYTLAEIQRQTHRRMHSEAHQQ